jgi:hypothetical protein
VNINIAMIGNLISTAFVAIAVWMSMTWQHGLYNDNRNLIALALAYGSGLLTALSSQFTVHIEKETDDKTNGEDYHDYKKTANQK